MSKRPWNIIDAQVYSLATYDKEKVNMNILTYASAVSIKPKRYAVAVYRDTKTLANLMKNDHAVLQILTTRHLDLVRSLGKRSGHHTDKDHFLKKKSRLTKWDGLDVLQACAGLIHLKVLSLQNAGDHELFLFDVFRSASFMTDAELLMLRHLRNKKIISI